MGETQSHRRAKNRAAGKYGKTEAAISRNRRVDAMTATTAIEIERSRHTTRWEKATRRLKASRRRRKILQVPQKNLEKAVKAMRRVGVRGTVRNMCGTQRRTVS